MKHNYWKIFGLVFLLVYAISACASPVYSTTSQGSTIESTAPAEIQPEKPALWIDTSIPSELAALNIMQSKVEIKENRDDANMYFELATSPAPVDLSAGEVVWVYALEAPFPTVTDGIKLDSLKKFWTGADAGELPFDSIEVSNSTRRIFDQLWGSSAPDRIVTVDEAQFTTDDFTQMRTWSIVPFEQIAPRWKVIKIDGVSPLDKPMVVNDYGLSVRFDLSVKNADAALITTGKLILSELPATNRDESKMTVLMMTGTTAMVRAIAYKMEIKGLDYPIEKVLPWFSNADLIHVSNEISFNENCPYPDAYQSGLRFCSAPKYIQTLQDLGVNVVELTGNHENDYGPEYFVDTINTYKALGWSVYGGGVNDSEARAPVKVEANGNKIAFIGCNSEGPATDWATSERAGAAKCDMKYFEEQISQLKAEGYVVVATFQQAEVYTNYVFSGYVADDFANSALAGADIVSGSQAHTPMSFHFVNNSLLHYGLGNFLFDTMTYEGIGEKVRREFIDRHIIYDGKYINTELLTAKLVDWSQPNPMEEQERIDFLTDMFDNGDWK